MPSASLYRAIIFCAIIAAISSCKPDYYFEESTALDQNTWTYANTLNYTIPIRDTQNVYNIYLNIDHSTEYAYQNIYLMIHTSYPSGEKISERLPIDFADKTGLWYGKCDNDFCQLSVNLQKDAFFNAVGDYTISVEQFMRIDSLTGIKNIALILEDTGRKRSQESGVGSQEAN